MGEVQKGQGMSKALSEITVTLMGCVRCEKGHKDLVFRKLKRPQDDFTHWAMCPTTGEPLLCKAWKASPKKGRA